YSLTHPCAPLREPLQCVGWPAHNRTRRKCACTNRYRAAEPAVHPNLIERPRGIRTMSNVFVQSAIVKRSVVLKGHKTSVTLEEPFWSGLWEIAREKGHTIGG